MRTTLILFGLAWCQGLAVSLHAEEEVAACSIAVGSYTGAAQSMLVRNDGEVVFNNHLAIAHCEFNENGSVKVTTPVKFENGAAKLEPFVLEPTKKMEWSRLLNDGRLVRARATGWYHMFSLKITIELNGEILIGSQQFFATDPAAASEVARRLDHPVAAVDRRHTF